MRVRGVAGVSAGGRGARRGPAAVAVAVAVLAAAAALPRRGGYGKVVALEPRRRPAGPSRRRCLSLQVAASSAACAFSSPCSPGAAAVHAPQSPRGPGRPGSRDMPSGDRRPAAGGGGGGDGGGRLPRGPRAAGHRAPPPPGSRRARRHTPLRRPPEPRVAGGRTPSPRGAVGAEAPRGGGGGLRGASPLDRCESISGHFPATLLQSAPSQANTHPPTPLLPYTPHPHPSLPLSLSFLGGRGCSAAGATTPLSCSFEHFPSLENHSQGGRNRGTGRPREPARAGHRPARLRGQKGIRGWGGRRPSQRPRALWAARQLHRHLVVLELSARLPQPQRLHYSHTYISADPRVHRRTPRTSNAVMHKRRSRLGSRYLGQDRTKLRASGSV